MFSILVAGNVRIAFVVKHDVTCSEMQTILRFQYYHFVYCVLLDAHRSCPLSHACIVTSRNIKHVSATRILKARFCYLIITFLSH